MPSIHVRMKKKTDIKDIINIIKSLPEWFTPNAVNEIALDGERLEGCVVEIDGAVRGFVLVDERECCIEIAWLAVDKEYHGRGLGTRLVHEVERHACRRGKGVVTVKTYGGSDYEPYRKTMEFYRKNGFKLYEVIESYPPFGGQPAAILVKPINCQHIQEDT
ncbi:MAG: GNAT family N-acetyltransferase [Crenarchaeota archaeon]|nr:GNAT family N-acetyltransferase [Thermoproteota archaeon]